MNDKKESSPKKQMTEDQFLQQLSEIGVSNEDAAADAARKFYREMSAAREKRIRELELRRKQRKETIVETNVPVKTKVPEKTEVPEKTMVPENKETQEHDPQKSKLTRHILDCIATVRKGGDVRALAKQLLRGA